MNHYKKTESEYELELLLDEASQVLPVLEGKSLNEQFGIIRNEEKEHPGIINVLACAKAYECIGEGLQVILVDKDAAKEILNTETRQTMKDMLYEAYDNFPYNMASIEVKISDLFQDEECSWAGDSKLVFFAWKRPTKGTDKLVKNLVGGYRLDDKQFDVLLEHEKEISEKVCKLIYYISCTNADIRCVYTPSKNIKPNNKKKRSGATIWEVGYRLGASLRAYERTKQYQHNTTGTTVRPHMRRAHFHTYHTNEGTTLHWLSPIFVNSELGDVGIVGHKVS